jgi:lactate permease
VRAVLAVAPIVSVVVLMLGCSWSAMRAGAATAVIAMVVGLGVFGREGSTTTGALVGIGAEAGFITVTIVGIIGPALALHFLQVRTGATEHLRGLLMSLHPDPRVGALAVGWFFALFLEGAAGFGTPIALAAPLLVAAGVAPLKAVVTALAGHAAGVCFGAVGTPVLAQSSVVGLPARQLAEATVVFPLVAGWLLLAVVIRLLGNEQPGLFRWGVAAGAAFFVPFGLIAVSVGAELATLGGAVIGFSAWAAALRRWGPAQAARIVSPVPWAAVARSSLPYGWLIAVVLVSRLMPPVRDVVQRLRWDWQFDGFSGGIRLLDHPAVLLASAVAAAALAQRVAAAVVWVEIKTATRRVVPVALAVFAMLVVARTMTQTGMTAELGSAVAGAGQWWPWLAPAIAALGTFVTGSATASNLLFSELHVDVATTSGLRVDTVLGAQGFGAAVGNIACPHNVVAGAATVGLEGKEGAVLRTTMPVAMLCVVVAGATAWVIGLRG